MIYSVLSVIATNLSVSYEPEAGSLLAPAEESSAVNSLLMYRLRPRWGWKDTSRKYHLFSLRFDVVTSHFLEEVLAVAVKDFPL